MLMFYKIYITGENKTGLKQKANNIFLPDKSRLDSSFRMGFRMIIYLSVGSLCAILGNECFAFFDKMFKVFRKTIRFVKLKLADKKHEVRQGFC